MKYLIREEVAELKEIESRKLNLICLNLPESNRTETVARQLPGNKKMEISVSICKKTELIPDDIKVNKLVRLGRIELNSDGTVKCRSLRFLVDTFDYKGQILTANSLLRSCDDDLFGSI